MDLLYYIIILILILIIDLPMILYINSNMYKNMLNNINKKSNNISNIRKYFSALVVYLLLTFAILWYIVPLKNNNYNYIFINGFILGIIIYGVYNGTNLATINEFGIKEALIDTTWGGILCGLTSIISIYIINNVIH